jgi:tetratricopeptide (TPR) repeat protein
MLTMLNNDDHLFLTQLLEKLIDNQTRREALFSVVYWDETNKPSLYGNPMDVAILVIRDLVVRTMRSGKQGVVVLIETLTQYNYVGYGRERDRLYAILNLWLAPPAPPIPDDDRVQRLQQPEPPIPYDETREQIIPAAPPLLPRAPDLEIAPDTEVGIDLPPTDVLPRPAMAGTPPAPARADPKRATQSVIIPPGVTSGVNARTGVASKASPLPPAPVPPETPPAHVALNADALLAELRAAHRREQWSEMIALGEALLRLKPNDSEGRALTAKAYYEHNIAAWREEQYDTAIADLTRALEIDPDNAQYYYSRGFSFHDKGDYPRAIADLDSAIRLNPRNDTYYAKRASAHLNSGNAKAAIDDYTYAIERSPRNTKYYYGRHVAYLKHGKRHEARADLELAAALGYQDAVQALALWK